MKWTHLLNFAVKNQKVNMILFLFNFNSAYQNKIKNDKWEYDNAMGIIQGGIHKMKSLKYSLMLSILYRIL